MREEATRFEIGWAALDVDAEWHFRRVEWKQFGSGGSEGFRDLLHERVVVEAERRQDHEHRCRRQRLARALRSRIGKARNDLFVIPFTVRGDITAATQTVGKSRRFKAGVAHLM